MHFELKCVFSLDLSLDKDSTRMGYAESATMKVHIISRKKVTVCSQEMKFVSEISE